MYKWPTTMLLPAKPPKLVYLDLNHWIALAKAHVDHRGGDRFKNVLVASETAVKDGKAVFPISSTIYFEISKIANGTRRRHLREVIERVSRFTVVTSRSVISVHEIETLLDENFGPSSDPINTMAYLDWGVFRAFGMVGGIVIRDEKGNDVTDEVRASHPLGPEKFDSVLWQNELDLNRSVLDSPTSEEDEAVLRARGWDPKAAFAVVERRAQQEIEQVARFDADPSWRGRRIRDVVAAREILIEINEPLWKGLHDRGIEDLEGAFPDPRVLDSMPSFDVAVTLKSEYHRDAGHPWTPNDIMDIDALGATLPYCDIVVTDKEAASHAIRSGLAQRMGTTVLSSLNDLPSLF